jgi:hypothetical protein
MVSVRRRGPGRTGRVLTTLGTAVLVAAALAGCSNVVPMSPAPSANSVACASAEVRLPRTVSGGLKLRQTNAQSTAAWGSPAAVLYHCGVAVPVVSDLPCFTLGRIDWIRDDRGKDVIYTTFGRTPAVQVVIDTSKATSDVLQSLARALDTLPKNSSRCLDPSDVATP